MTTTRNDPAPDVVLDLLAEDAQLREAIGDPVPIRVPGGKDGAGVVIRFPLQGAWPHMAARFANVGAWQAWADLVLAGDEDALTAWQAADLRLYQIERIVAAITAASGISPGKR